MEYFKVLSDEKVQCLLCPQECILSDGEPGKCLARIGEGNRVTLKGFGKVTTMAVEPIEKKPLFHYQPGMKTLSVGFYGCSMSCNYCQNWKVSQNNRHDTAKTISPSELVQMANEKCCNAICFTYNEPTVYYEYILAVSACAALAGIKVILKTNALVNPEPWKSILQLVDALNIDWKGNSEFAFKMVGSKYDIVPNIITAIESGKHVEISVPVYSNCPSSDYDYLISSLKPYKDTPIHLLKVFPAHLIQIENTTEDALIGEVKGKFLKYFNYVYDGNDRNTVCSLCNKINLRRVGYIVADEDYTSSCEQCSKLLKQTHG